MVGQAIITFFRNIIDDQPDADLEIDLLNHAKDVVEGMRDWEILKKLNTSLSASPSDTYTTAKGLPSDFLRPVTVYVGDQEHEGVPFEHRELYKSSGLRYYIDYLNNNLYVIGAPGSTQAINLFYIHKTTDWTSNNLSSLSPVWPSKYHKVLAFIMSELHGGGIDVDQIQAGQIPMRNKHGELLLNGMISWDSKLKLSAMAKSASPRRTVFADDPDIINEDVLI